MPRRHDNSLWTIWVEGGSAEAVQDGRAALHRGALQVGVDGPQAPLLLATAGPAGATVDQLRHRDAVPGRLRGALPVQDEDAPVVGGGAGDDAGDEVAAVGDDGAGEAPFGP